jgi:hypothetical protein
MERLTKPELARYRAWMSEWRLPADMTAYVAAVNDAMGSANFFRQRGVEVLRDAGLAAEFGRHRQSSSVRLVAGRERWPILKHGTAAGSSASSVLRLTFPAVSVAMIIAKRRSAPETVSPPLSTT